ncbi:acetate--CoA ligase family protein [Chloroflexota bacterium]
MKENGKFKVADLNLLFKPRSLAVIGVSSNPHRGGGLLWQRLIEQGYNGGKYPVSIRHDEIGGDRCYRSVRDIEEVVDLAIIAVPAATVEKVVNECADKGIKHIVIHSAGFAELGEEGAGLQQRLFDIARRNGIRIVGPNCMGLFCPDVQMNTIVEPVDNIKQLSGGVAFSGQSGWATEEFIVGGSSRGLQFSTVVSSGNQADLDTLDYITFFNSDPETRVISAYVEGLKRGREFLNVAREISASKPILICKSGLSAAGARAVMSHTGSVAGSREIWLSAAKGAGIVTADGLEDLIDLTVAFSIPIYPKGRKVGILVEAGGGGAVASDACERVGLEVKPFSESLKEKIKEFLTEYLPPFSGISNPLDFIWLPADDTAFTICVRSIEMLAEEVDSIVYMTYQPFNSPELRPRYIKELCRLRDEFNTPIFVVPPHPSREAVAMQEFTMAGLPAFYSFGRATKSIAAIAKYQEWRAIG